MTRRVRAALHRGIPLSVVLATLAVTAVTATPAPDATLPQPGGRTDRVTVPDDPEQSYALFLPEGYRPDEPRPILYCFDPRARGSLCLDLVIGGAGRHGWIVASSNNSMSDGPFEPNRRAMLAMWHDTHRRLAIDDRRIYAIGFSGGSRVGNILGQMVGAAGIIAVGGGFPPSAPLTEAVPFDVYGLVGIEDFNYYEMRVLDRDLARLEIAHRLEIVDGGHRWAPPGSMERAIDWLELRAAVRGLRAADPELVSTVAGNEIAYASQLIRKGRGDEALARLRGLRDDLRALPSADVTADFLRKLDEEIARLERDTAVKRRTRERKRWDRRGEAYLDRLSSVLERLRGDGPLPSVERLIADLELDRLIEASHSEDSGEETWYARRLLSMVRVQGRSTQYRALALEGRWDRAAVALELALAVRPNAPVDWYNLGCVRARAGRTEAALDALERSLALGFDRCGLMREDPDLAALRELGRYGALVSACASDSDVSPP